jgi:signal transduction histidine kinase/ligand-binding sensor domain-containing protein
MTLNISMRVFSLQLFAIVALLAGTLNAQRLGPVRFEHITVDQGLSSPTVSCIYQDRVGYIWFGTHGGLDRYDGHTITSYRHVPEDSSSISNGWVQSVFEDRENTLWLGTSRGLDKLDRASGTFKHYRPYLRDIEGHLQNLVSSIHEDGNGLLWLGTWGGGLLTFDREAEKFTYLRHDENDSTSISHNSVNVIYKDKAGSVWVGCGGGLEKLDMEKRRFIRYWYDPNMKDGFVADWLNSIHWVTAIYEDKSGILWLGTNGGLVEFDHEAGTYVVHAHDPKNPQSLAANNVSSLLEDQSGVLWVGTWDGGLSAFDRSSRQFINYGHSNNDPRSISVGGVASMMYDRAGTVWVGSNEGGVNKLDRVHTRFRHYRHDPRDAKSLQDDDVRVIFEDRQSRIWVGTSTGLDILDQKANSFTHYVPWEGHYSVTGLAEDQSGNMWVGNRWGLNKVQRLPYRRTFYDTSPQFGSDASPPNLCSIHEDRDGVLWMIHGVQGLLQFDHTAEKFVRAGAFRGRTDIATNIILEDTTSAGKVRLWIGSREGLWRYDAGTKNFTQFAHTPRNPHSLSSNEVTSLSLGSDSTVWVGTDKGLNRLTVERGTFQRYDKSNGLPGNIIFGILADRHSRLWLSTDKGIARFDPRTERFNSYDSTEGLPSIRYSKGCSLRSSSGEMYFGGVDGFVRFHPDSIRDNPYIPRIVITGFRKSDTPLFVDSIILHRNTIELTHEEDVFSFEFVSLSYMQSGKNQYAYKLEGYDKEWNYCGVQRNANYKNVNPGNYIFRVKGSNNDGIWNEEGTSIAVIITPPFWKTWWFTTLAFVSLLLSVGGTIRYVEKRKLMRRIEQLEQERALERERARISQDMHDEVGASLSEIVILSELAKKKPEEADVRVQEISERAAEVIDSVSEIVWAMNPKNDTLDNLVAHLRRYAVKYLSLAQINCKFTAPDVIPAHHLTADVRRNLFLVVKEALHNVVRHAGASEVSITARRVDKKLEITIEDNGRGFSVEQSQQSGNGLASMSKRVTDIGGKFQVESQPGKGTRVEVRLPNSKY